MPTHTLGVWSRFAPGAVLTPERLACVGELVTLAYRQGLKEGYASGWDEHDPLYPAAMVSFRDYLAQVSVTAHRHDDGALLTVHLPEPVDA